MACPFQNPQQSLKMLRFNLLLDSKATNPALANLVYDSGVGCVAYAVNPP